jgi:hypothetical protein
MRQELGKIERPRHWICDQATQAQHVQQQSYIGHPFIYRLIHVSEYSLHATIIIMTCFSPMLPIHILYITLAYLLHTRFTRTYIASVCIAIFTHYIKTVKMR